MNLKGKVFRGCFISSLHVVIQYTEKTLILSFVLIFNLNTLQVFKGIFGIVSSFTDNLQTKKYVQGCLKDSPITICLHEP